MTHYVSKYTLKNILRKMARRPWHISGGRVLDFNNKPLVKVIDEGCPESKLIMLAPEIALSYIELLDENEELHERVAELEGNLESLDQRKTA